MGVRVPPLAHFAAMMVLCVAAGGCLRDVLMGQPAGSYLRASLGRQPVHAFGAQRGHRMAFYETDDDALHIQGYDLIDQDTDHTLSLHVPHPREGERYSLSTLPGGYGIYSINDIGRNKVTSYHTSGQSSRVLVLTRFDRRNRIIEGRFSFEGHAPSGTMPVDSGSFVMRFREETLRAKRAGSD